MAMTCAQALQAAAALGLDRLDAQLLLLHALGRPDAGRAWLLAHDDDVLDETVNDAFHQLCLRRSNNEPLAYLVGYKEFFGQRLKVDARVLVPRPDTETLVQWALDLAPQWAFTQKIRVLDLGTGSGAIALALAHTWRQQGRPVEMSAIDASADALTVARENAAQLGLTVQFAESTWLDKVSDHFHLILSNPPYIADADDHLAALKHEPLEALTAGTDGLDDIRQIIGQAPGHLHAGGWLLLEHGYDQSGRVCELLAEQGFTQVQSHQDIAGINRCSGGQWFA
ncbi:MAG: peptide chain release factor N(5)-glutamine methyltransferase [Polaromonas sp.]|uniref:peptide chain release factor N(5)-glutamine methyltransferase n=1 Tax=Polaromonas sp. TaxID=1869339 RepID=UPI0025FBA967|nr:peptide chain release factor N(5)-glutamine methyltransferase [Polaromonas sp.]MBI2727306.1 peptide chain release factor N(5)-glutamine methyltransferase [Polaromonas sp.]